MSPVKKGSPVIASEAKQSNLYLVEQQIASSSLLAMTRLLLAFFDWTQLLNLLF
jgi:hypothetical protein